MIKPDITQGNWHWVIHDESMASLGESDTIENHVMSVSPCKSCIERIEKGDSPFGKCTMPNDIDAKAISAVPNLIDVGIKIIYCHENNMDITEAEIEELKQALLKAGCTETK